MVAGEVVVCKRCATSVYPRWDLDKPRLSAGAAEYHAPVYTSHDTIDRGGDMVRSRIDCQISLPLSVFSIIIGSTTTV